MAHHSIHWRQAGLVVLIVAGAHLVLGMLFLISRKGGEAPQAEPATEVWLLPRREMGERQARTAPLSPQAPAYRRVVGTHVPSDVAPIAVDGAVPPDEAPHDTAERERLGTALRHGQACRKAMMSGMPLPPDCPDRGLSYAQTGPLPVKPGAQPHWDEQVAASEKARRYKTEPGNTEYWQRVNRSRSDPQRYTPQE